MDKASTVRDAIEYIKLLQDEERIIQSQISEMESIISMSSLLPNNNNNNNINNIENDDQEAETYFCMPKKRARMEFSDESNPIEVLESDEEEKDVLRVNIEAAIAALNNPHSPISS
ncbi:hypothetical protein ABFS82_12G160600 [Erythranthe guttata]